MCLFLNHRTHGKCNSILVIVNKWGVTLIETSQVGFHWLAIMRPDWSIHANWGFSMVDRQSNWSLISAVRHIWAPYHHDQCWVSLLPTAPGGVPSGGMEVLMMWWHSFLPSLTLSGPETTQRDQATKYRRPNNTKYKIPRWQQIQNTNYRAGNKYKLQGWQQIQNTELATKPNWINHNPLALQPSFLSSQWSSTYTRAKTICTINFAIYKNIWKYTYHCNHK